MEEATKETRNYHDAKCCFYCDFGWRIDDEDLCLLHGWYVSEMAVCDDYKNE